MNSFIISSKDEQKGVEKALKICKEFKIDKFDITIIEHNDDEKLKAIGIEEIREIQKRIFLKPLKSDFKSVIIKNSQNLTIPAQNALLKILEEPPLTTLIILLATNRDILLPTVISRCNILEIHQENLALSEKEVEKNIKIVKLLANSNVAGRLKIAGDVSKSKEDALNWLKDAIFSLRKETINTINSSETSESIQILNSLQKTHSIISTTNVNPRFAIENLFLNL